MKKIALFVLLSTSSIGLFAQDSVSSDSISIKPVKNDFGVSLDLIGVINSVTLNALQDLSGNQMLLLRYYLKDNLALRLGFGITSTNIARNTADSVTTTQVDTAFTYGQTDVFLGLGVEKHLFSSKRLDPYIGLKADFGFIGQDISNTKITITDTCGLQGSCASTEEIRRKYGGGFALGLNVFTGFNYFFAQKLAIGAEVMFGLNYSATGGEWETVTITKPTTGAETYDTQRGDDFNSSTGLSVNATAGITLSYFFGLKSRKKKS